MERHATLDEFIMIYEPRKHSVHCSVIYEGRSISKEKSSVFRSIFGVVTIEICRGIYLMVATCN